MYQVFKQWAGRQPEYFQSARTYEDAQRIIDSENDRNDHFDGLVKFSIITTKKNMSYSNFSFRPNYGGYGNSFRNNPNGRGYNSGFTRSFPKRQASGKRRSHCRIINKGNVIYISGWKIGSKAGFRTFFVSPSKNNFVKTSKTGKVWHGCRVSVLNKTHGTSGFFPGLIEESTKKVFVRDLNLMINPVTGYISYLPQKGRK